MRRLLLLGLLFSSAAAAIPLSTIGSFCSTFPSQCQKGTESLLAARGTGTDVYYVLEVDPTTGAIPVSGTFTPTYAGATGAAVPSNASYTGFNNGGTLIGGIADSSGRQIVAGAGTAGAAAGGVLTVQGSASGTAIPISSSTLATEASLAKIPLAQASTTSGQSGSLVQGAVTTAAPTYVTGQTDPLSLTTGGALRVDNTANTQPTNVAQFGGTNVSTGAGAGGAGIPRVTVSNDSTVGLVAGSAIVGKVGIDQTTPGTTNGVQVNAALPAGTAIIGKVGIDQTTPGTTNLVKASNLPTTVDTNTGAESASTLRVVTATRSEAAATPLAVRQTNGTSFADYGSGALATTTLRVVAATDNPAGAGRAYADSVRYAYSSGAAGTVSWVQLIASTAALINCIQLFDSSGQTLELGTGGAGAETRVLIIPPGGLDACVPLKIAASTRIAVRALSATTGTVGEIDISGFQ